MTDYIFEVRMQKSFEEMVEAIESNAFCAGFWNLLFLSLRK